MQTIERVIILALLRDMRAAGFQPVAVWDGEEYTMAVGGDKLQSYPSRRAPGRICRALTDAEAFQGIESVDECTLHFTHKDRETWGNRGVLLILGNGEDVISDYHAGDENFNLIVESIYAAITAGKVP